MSAFVVVGRTASADPEFSLADLPSTSGRLDVLLRCVRAALLRSDGIRADVVVYLVLLGGPRAPRTLRIEGGRARFVRPDERSLATLVQKTLAAAPGEARFVEVRPGVSIVEGGLDAVLDDLGERARYVLELGAPDLRHAAPEGDAAFFVGDHLGLDAATRARLEALGARPVGLGPVSLHADDAVAIVTNELDRRAIAP